MKKTLKVQYNHHIQALGNYYSVPYEHCGATVEVSIEPKVVVICRNGQSLCTHPRIFGNNRYQTDKSHMPPAGYEGRWTSSKLKAWANNVGTNTYEVVERILQSSAIEQHGYKSIMAILLLSRRYGRRTVDKACERSMAHCLFPLFKEVKKEINLISGNEQHH